MASLIAFRRSVRLTRPVDFRLVEGKRRAYWVLVESVRTERGPRQNVVLPTDTGREIRNRCVAKPTEHQRILLDKLGLRLPTRIREGEMVWKRKSQNPMFS